MRPRGTNTLALLCVAFLAATGLGVFLPPIHTLDGVAAPAQAPEFGWGSLRTGALARFAETWFSENVGLRYYWVSLDRQLSYSVFREAPSLSSGTRIVQCGDDWLVEHHYLKTALTPGWWDAPRTTVYAARLRRLQDKLEARGIPFLYVIASSI